MCLKKQMDFQDVFHIKTKYKLHCHIFDKLDLMEIQANKENVPVEKFSKYFGILQIDCNNMQKLSIFLFQLS